MALNNVRTDVKNAVANVLKNITALKSVYTYRPKIDLQTQLPRVVVALPSVEEVRVSGPAPNGKKFVKFVVQLEISHIDVSNDGSGQLTFDSLLDQIDVQLRAQEPIGGDLPNGGSIIASTVEYIRTKVAQPYKVNGQNLLLLAIKQFDLVVQITG